MALTWLVLEDEELALLAIVKINKLFGPIGDSSGINKFCQLILIAVPLCINHSIARKHSNFSILSCE